MEQKEQRQEVWCHQQPTTNTIQLSSEPPDYLSRNPSNIFDLFYFIHENIHLSDCLHCWPTPQRPSPDDFCRPGLETEAGADTLLMHADILCCLVKRSQLNVNWKLTPPPPHPHYHLLTEHVSVLLYPFCLCSLPDTGIICSVFISDASFQWTCPSLCVFNVACSLLSLGLHYITFCASIHAFPGGCLACVLGVVTPMFFRFFFPFVDSICGCGLWQPLLTTCLPTFLSPAFFKTATNLLQGSQVCIPCGDKPPGAVSGSQQHLPALYQQFKVLEKQDYSMQLTRFYVQRLCRFTSSSHPNRAVWTPWHMKSHVPAASPWSSIYMQDLHNDLSIIKHNTTALPFAALLKWHP